MKKLIFFLFTISLFASNQTTIKNIIGSYKYNKYKNLINQTIKPNASLEEILTALKENGLIDLFFKSPRVFQTNFKFIHPNPKLDNMILINTIKNIGYLYFYPSKIDNNSNIYKISIEMKSDHFIDPLAFTQEIQKYKCKVRNIIKRSTYTYTIDCSNADLQAYKITPSLENLSNRVGEYWLDTNGFKKVLIKSAKNDNFHPYVVFYDRNLNILNIISSNSVKKQLTLNVPGMCKYIKIKDNFSRANIKRGIFVKGIQ